MRQRSFQLSAVLLVAALVAGACGGGGGGSPATGSSGAPTEKVKLRLTTWAGEDEAKELQSLVLDKINAASKEFEIVHEAAPADYYTKLQTSLAGGTGADFLWLSQEYVAGYASRGALLDLTGLLGASDSPAAKIDSYFPEVVKPAKYQDKLYGLPWISQPVVLYYNPKLFDSAGVKYPDESWDWAMFMDNAKKLTKDTNGDGKPDQYGFTANGWPPVHQFIWQAGGEVISPDLKSSPIDSAEAIRGVEQYASLIWNQQCCPSEATLAEQGFGEMFKAGKVAMFMGGAADTFVGLGKVGASVVPKGPANRANLAYVAVTAVNAKTKNPQVAAKALAALTDAIHHWKIVAPRPDLANAETILQSIPQKWQEQKKDQVAAIVAAAKDMRAFNIIPRHQEWDELFWREFQDPVYHKKGSAADLAKTARSKLEALMK
jgi:multiple sugar transport system substrate-binding protein